tara:strand:+ start:2381 stop:2551 length:171 start_codon:yes stop_codon:yes gene_type:complete
MIISNFDIADAINIFVDNVRAGKRQDVYKIVYAGAHSMSSYKAVTFIIPSWRGVVI